MFRINLNRLKIESDKMEKMRDVEKCITSGFVFIFSGFSDPKNKVLLIKLTKFLRIEYRIIRFILIYFGKFIWLSIKKKEDYTILVQIL